MCCLSCQFTMFWLAISAAIIANLYYFGHDQRVRVNIPSVLDYGQYIQLPDYIVVAILFLSFIIYVDPIIGYWEESDRISAAEKENRKLRNQHQKLATEFAKLKRVCEKIQIMIPYSLHTIVQDNMIETIPSINYFPVKNSTTQLLNQSQPTNIVSFPNSSIEQKKQK